jgi:hypothetical protein
MRIRLGCFIISLLSLLSTTQSLTITGTSSSPNFTGSYIPTIVEQNCYYQAAAVSTSEFLLVRLNYSIRNLGKNEYPSRVIGVNVSMQALYYDLGEFPVDLAYIEDFYDIVKAHGFDALVIRLVYGDLSFYSWGALRFWKKKDCVTPTFLILDDAVSNEFKSNLEVFSKLDFEDNHAITFIKSPGYIIGVSLPSFLCVS